MDLKLRKFAKFVDKTFIEGGKKAKEPVLLVSVAAVIENPWAGKGFVKDLKPEILDLAPQLGDLLVPELTKEIGSGEKILAYGKAAMVGLNGEIEHASAFIHTLRFGNKFRDAVGGTSYLSFTNTRGPAGAKISIPMMHKTLQGEQQYSFKMFPRENSCAVQGHSNTDIEMQIIRKLKDCGFYKSLLDSQMFE